MEKGIKELEVKIEGKEWQDALDKAFEKNNKKANINGFRPGKAPKEVYIKKYGIESLFMDAGDEVLEKAYTKTLIDNKDILDNVVAKPEIELKSVDENKIEFKFIFTLKPEVKLGKYKGLDVKKEEVKVEDKEVEQTIKQMQSRYAEEVLKEGAIEDGDIAIIDFEGFIGKEAFEGGKGDNYSLKIGSGTFIPGFEEQLVGLKAGEEKDVVVTFPEDYHSEDLKGKEATFKVKVNEVKEVEIPEVDEDFFADLNMEGVDSKEKLEEKVKEDILKHKEMHAENKYIDELLEKAIENVEVEIPSVMIEEEKNFMLEQYANQLASQGISLEQYYMFTGSDETALKDQMTDEAEKKVKIRLMLEEIIKVEKIEITDEDANKKAEEMAESYQMEVSELIDSIGGLDVVKYDMQMRKAVEVLKEN